MSRMAIKYYSRAEIISPRTFPIWHAPRRHGALMSSNRKRDPNYPACCQNSRDRPQNVGLRSSRILVRTPGCEEAEQAARVASADSLDSEALLILGQPGIGFFVWLLRVYESDAVTYEKLEFNNSPSKIWALPGKESFIRGLRRYSVRVDLFCRPTTVSSATLRLG